MAANAAVSVRITRGPSDTAEKPAKLASSYSLLPVLAALFCARGIKSDDAVLGQNRCDSFYAKFGRFLDHEIHALAARYALNQMYFQR